MILTQKAETVRSTNDLSNTFTLVVGFHFDNQRSNSTHRLYSANGNHISIENYNNDTKVDLCLSQGCDYIFNMLLISTVNVRTLSLNVTYGGGAGLNELLILDAVTLHYDGQTVTN